MSFIGGISDGGGSPSVIKGNANGFITRYDTTTRVTIDSGNYEGNGKDYILNADTTHTLVGLLSGFDFHYIYIDDSASVLPAPTFIDVSRTIAVPTFDPVRKGWYNGDDRLVGVVNSPIGSAIIEYFDTIAYSGKFIRNTIDHYNIALKN